MNTVYIFLSVCVLFSVSFQVIAHIHYKVFSLLARLIPRYFILLIKLQMGLFFLNFVSDNLLFVYRNTKFLYMNFASCNFT